MKDCPKCNFTCADNDVVCKNCGYIFAPVGFEDRPSPTPNQNGYGMPQNNIPPQNGYGIPGQPQNPGYNGQNPFNIGQGGNPNFVEPHNNGMSVASLVLGIIGVVGICCAGLGAILGIISLIFGFVSMNNIKKSGGAKKGKGMALAGIILGAVAILFGVLVFFRTVNVLQDPQFMKSFMQSYSQAIKNYNSSNG